MVKFLLGGLGSLVFLGSGFRIQQWGCLAAY